MNKYYRKIHLTNFDKIQKQCLEVVKMHNNVFERYEEHSSYYLLDYRVVKEHCTALVEALSEYNLKCNYAMAYVMYEPKHTKIHMDKHIHRCRINLPVINCDNTFTCFYENVDMYENVTPLGRHHKMAVEQDYVPVDKIEMTSPAVIAVQQPHKVVMPENAPAPRITMSLGTSKDPTFLLDPYWYKNPENYCDLDLLKH